MKYYFLSAVISFVLIGCGDGTSVSEDEYTVENLEKVLDKRDNQEVSDDYKLWEEEYKKDGNLSIKLISNEYNITVNKYAIIPSKYELVEDSDYTRSIKRAVYPRKFDLRDPNGDGDTDDTLISPVKNQGSCGSCWSFAAYGTLEGSYNSGSDEFFDFSEDNLKHRHGFTHSNDACAGGNIWMIANYHSRLDGAISEEEDPYNQSSNSNYCTNCTSHRYIDNLLIYPGRTSSGVDTQLIKDLLVNEKKAVYIAVLVGWGTAGESGNSHYDEATHSFYSSSGTSVNHAVTVVGYDDDKVVQGQTGVFIIKNSWGTNTGENGYHYIPYSDKTIGKGYVAVFDDIDDNLFKVDKVYSHDDYGLTGNSWSINEPHNYVMNIFTATQNGYIKAVNMGIWIGGRKIALEVHKLNGNTLPTWGDKSTRQGKTVEPNRHYETGYHTIEIDEPFEISVGDKFAIIADYKKVNTSTQYTLPSEVKKAGSTGNATASAEESYLLWGNSWYDMGANYGANWLLKAISVDSLEQSNSTPIANAGDDQSVETSTIVTLDGSNSSDSDGDSLSYVWSVSSKPIGSNTTLTNSSSVNPTFNADVAGTYIFNLIVNDGTANSNTDSVTITVTTQQPPNQLPIADAGVDQIDIILDSTVTLDGSASNDIDNDALSYKWTIKSKPNQSVVTLVNDTSVHPTFQPDKDGEYIIELKVYDGTEYSIIDEVSIKTKELNVVYF
ncbi:MAG: C1 family peptidase [Campylobacterota bacterium]|nr:C1 family peptidase [Campylobacterota bacterium]